MVMKFTNNATSTLASGITSTATSLTVASGQGVLFPSLSAGDYFYCTLANVSGTVEIIKVTARSTDTFTVTRGQDGTTGVAWNSGDKVELRLVAASLNDIPKLDEANTFTGANAYGTPTSITLTSATGLPLTTGVTGTLGAANGGTGVANNAASTLTISGNFATTLTVSGAYNYTLPAASDTLVNLGSTQTLTSKTLTNPTVTNYTESVVSIGNSGTSQTLSLTSGTVQTVTLTGNCTFTMPTATAGKSFILIVVQDGTGSRTATFTSVKWPSGSAPTMTTTATTGRDIFAFVSDGTNWYGTIAQAFA